MWKVWTAKAEAVAAELVIILTLYLILRDSLSYAIIHNKLLSTIIPKKSRAKTMPEKKLADRIREAIRLRGYSYRTEKAYVHWYERYARFHKLRHPSTMGAAEVEQFLIHLASQEQVAASTQNQALSALLFLYRDVLRIPLDNLDIVRARRTTYVQPYLSHDMPAPPRQT